MRGSRTLRYEFASKLTSNSRRGQRPPDPIAKYPAPKTNTHIEVLPPSVYTLRGIIFYTVAKINENLMLYDFKVNAIIYR